MSGSERPGTFPYQVKQGLRRLWELPLLIRIFLLSGALVLALVLVSGGDGDDASRSSSADDEAAQQTTPTSLESLMKISRLRCGFEQAAGLVTNGSTATVQVFIDVQFLDGKGVIIDDSIATVRGIRPGESAEWEAPYLGVKTPFECRAQVSSAFR